VEVGNTSSSTIKTEQDIYALLSGLIVGPLSRTRVILTHNVEETARFITAMSVAIALDTRGLLKGGEMSFGEVQRRARQDFGFRGEW